MDLAHDLSLSPLPGEVARSVVTAPEGFWRIEGARLEGGWRLPDGALLVATVDDIPYEEGLHLHLLEARGVDRITLSAMYATGAFRVLETGSAHLKFSFFSDRDWCLKTRPHPHLRLPFSDPRGVLRSPGLRSRLSLSAIPRRSGVGISAANS